MVPLEIPLQRRYRFRAKLFEGIAEIMAIIKEYVSGEMSDEEFQTNITRIVDELTSEADRVV